MTRRENNLIAARSTCFKSKQQILLLFFIFVCSLTGSSFAQAPIILDDSKKFYGHENSFLFLIDEQHQYSLQDIGNRKFTESFKPATGNDFNFGLTPAAVWYQFTLVNKTGDKWLLQSANPTVEEVTLYIPRVSGKCDSVSINLMQKISERPWQNNAYLFTLPFPDSNTQKFFLRITSYHSMNIPQRIGTIESFFVRNHYEDFWQGVYLGFIFIMVLYNLFVFVSVRDISYLYYVLYVLCIGLLVSMHNAYPFDLFWHEFPFLNTYIDMLTSLSGVFAILFTMNFLKTKMHTPRIHKGLYVLMSIYIVAGILVIIEKTLLASIAEEIGGFLGALYVFFLAIYIYRMGYKPGKFYLLAWSVLILSIIFFVLNDMRVIDTYAMHIDPLQVGSAGEALLLSFALADRFNSYKKEKEELITKQNLMLEASVRERTAELSAALDHLNTTQEQLVQHEKLASIGQLTAGIAHEINNPINFVSSNIPSLKRNFADIKKLLSEYESAPLASEHKQKIEQLKNELEFSETLKESDILLEGIFEGATRTAKIVKGLRNFSRTDENETLTLQITEGIESTLILLGDKIAAKNISVEKRFSSVPSITCFPGQLNQLWMNLFSNAIDAVDKNGTITLSVSVASLQNELLISVRDNGKGMSEEVKKKIFDPFFTTKKIGQGTGLGLSISYGIVEKHKGKIEVKSEPGKGTDFVITLPVQ